MTRTDDETTRSLVEPLNDPQTQSAVRAERALLGRLGGGCQLPLGALGVPCADGLRLWGLVASLDGRRVVRGDVTGGSGEPDVLGYCLAELLRQRGAEVVLNELSDTVPGGMTEREGGF